MQLKYSILFHYFYLMNKTIQFNYRCYYWSGGTARLMLSYAIHQCNDLSPETDSSSLLDSISKKLLCPYTKAGNIYWPSTISTILNKANVRDDFPLPVRPHIPTYGTVKHVNYISKSKIQSKFTAHKNHKNNTCIFDFFLKCRFIKVLNIFKDQLFQESALREYRNMTSSHR